MKNVRYVQTMALGEHRSMCQMSPTVALADVLPGRLIFRYGNSVTSDCVADLHSATQNPILSFL